MIYKVFWELFMVFFVEVVSVYLLSVSQFSCVVFPVSGKAASSKC